MTIVFASIFLLQFISTFALLSGSLSALGSCSVVQNQRHGITPSIQSHQNELIQGNIQQIGICVLSEDAELYDTARSLAERLSIPFVSETTSDIFDHYNHALTIIRYPIGSTEGTALGIQSLRRDSHHNINRKGRQIPLPTPFFVDFCPQEGSTLERRIKGKSGTDLLVKAVGAGKVRSNSRQGAVVYDLTAGFGQDSLILAQNGASHVHMIERNPIVATLLQDALDRLELLSRSDDARQAKALKLVSRISLQVGDGAQAVKCTPFAIPPPDCIYLDPMFAPRVKSAAVKKNMQILHGLLESQHIDEAAMNLQEIELLEAAMESSASRVVVKRPIQAPPLGGFAYTSSRKVSNEMKGSVNRWDVYVK